MVSSCISKSKSCCTYTTPENKHTIVLDENSLTTLELTAAHDLYLIRANHSQENTIILPDTAAGETYEITVVNNTNNQLNVTSAYKQYVSSLTGIHGNTTFKLPFNLSVKLMRSANDTWIGTFS